MQMSKSLAVATAPPVQGFHRRAKRQSAGRDERDQANPSGARARAKRCTDGRRLPNFRFKGRPSRDDDLSAVRLLRLGEGRSEKERERSDGRAPGDAGSAICVQRLDDSLNSAIHTRYRSLLRSSSMHEPRGPPLEVVFFFSDSQPTRRKKRNRRNRKRNEIEKDGGGARGRRKSSPASARLSSGRREPPNRKVFLDPRSEARKEEKKRDLSLSFRSSSRPPRRCTWVSAKKNHQRL